MEIVTALVGYGSGGRIYNAPVISSVEGFRIKKILTTSSFNIDAAKSDFPETAIIRDFSEVIQDEEIQLVVVLLPNHLHYSFAKKALEAGKNVIVEKPFTTTVKEANELIEIAGKNDLILTVNHNRRYDSDFLTLKKIKESGRLGEIVLFESHFDRFREQVKPGWKEDPEIPGHGILYDLGSHLIDQALVTFGTPLELFADIRIQRKEAKVPDSFEVLLFYPNLKVSLNAGMLVKEKGPKFSIFGTKGSFIKYGMDVQEEALKQGIKPSISNAWGTEPESLWGKLETEDGRQSVASEKGDYTKVYKNLRNAIVGKEELHIKPEQARDVIKVIELAVRSNSSRCAVKYPQ